MPLHSVNSPITVGVEQAASKVPGILQHNAALPRLQLNGSRMLPARSVLRQAAFYESYRMTADIGAVHSRIVADGTDKICAKGICIVSTPGGIRTHT
jgi:hypothetical protein